VSVLRSVPLYVGAFTCHMNVFAVYNESPHLTRTRSLGISTASVLTAIVAYGIVGLLGARTANAGVSETMGGGGAGGGGGGGGGYMFSSLCNDKTLKRAHIHAHTYIPHTYMHAFIHIHTCTYVIVQSTINITSTPHPCCCWPRAARPPAHPQDTSRLVTRSRGIY
jgi:hypothetical protein